MGKEKKRKMDDSSNQNVESKKSKKEKKEKIPKSGDAKKKNEKINNLVNNDKYLSDEVKNSSTIRKRHRDEPKQVEADDNSNDEASDKNKISEEHNENLNMTKKRMANESQLCTETITEKKKKKKEKKKVSSETDKVVGDSEKTSARDLALEYLKKWHENRKQWSFQKVRQVWILQHMYDTQKVPDEEFKILLEYMENSKGKARENTIKQAEEVIEKFEETDNDSAAKEGYMRARQVLQMLS